MKDALLGRIAVEKGMITDAQLDQALREQDRSPKNLGEILVSKGLLDDAKLAELLQEQERRIQALDQFKQMQKVEYLFGQLLVKNNLATQLQINKCLEIQLKMAEKGVTPIPRLGELLVEHGFVDKKTVADVLKMQDKDVLFCTGCGRQYNVVGLEEGKAYKCKECGGVMLRRGLLESLKADETTFGFEMPTEER